MSALKRKIYRKKLSKLLGSADDEAFFQMVWALDAIQSDRSQFALPYLSFPREAVDPDIGSEYAIHKWDLKSLANRLLLTPKKAVTEGPRRIPDCRQFATGAHAINLLRSLENAEAAIYIPRMHIFTELHRVGQRQFSWQRGFLNLPQFYRYAFIYGQGECQAYFGDTYGLSFDQFSLIGFGLYTATRENPSIKSDYDMSRLGISGAALQKALKLILRPVSDARLEAERLTADINRKHGSEIPTAYQPSILRRYPLISFGNNNQRLQTPLHQLLLLRITSGVYYDLVGGPSNLRNEAADRFEQYCANFISANLSQLQVSRSHKYTFRRNQIDSPDLLVKKEGMTILVIECKATKLTYGAQFAPDPIEEAKKGYDEL